MFDSDLQGQIRDANKQFDRWLIESCTSGDFSAKEREARLVGWKTAPGAIHCHPREEHLVPLHVCYGAAMSSSPVAEVVFNDDIGSKLATGLLWK